MSILTQLWPLKLRCSSLGLGFVMFRCAHMYPFNCYSSWQHPPPSIIVMIVLPTSFFFVRLFSLIVVLPISLLNVCFIVNVAPTPLQCTWVLEIKRVAKCNPFLGSWNVLNIWNFPSFFNHMGFLWNINDSRLQLP